MIQKSCENCGELFQAYPSNVKRGHAKTCSFSCGTILRKRKQRESIPQLERFLAKVTIPAETDGCWEWKGRPYGGGYGYFPYRIPGENEVSEKRSHRVAWLLHNSGPIPDGLFVCHRCDNRKCVNPKHLFLGTHEENMLDMRNKGRQAKQDGQRNPRAKLTPDQVAYIRSDASKGLSSISLGKRFGVCSSAILRIRSGKGWKFPK